MLLKEVKSEGKKAPRTEPEPDQNFNYKTVPMNSFWRVCLACFEKELPPQQFRTWIKPLKCHAEGDTVTLVAPNRFVQQWIRDKFAQRIEELARDIPAQRRTQAPAAEKSRGTLPRPHPHNRIGRRQA